MKKVIPSNEIKILTLDILLEINKKIKIHSTKNPRIEYGNKDDPIFKSKLEKLIALTPNRDILDIAAYYLKNIILIQAFPDANHRTALTAVRVFFDINDHIFSHTEDEAFEFQKEFYAERFKIYGTYELMPTRVLSEKDNNLFLLCLKFVKSYVE